MKETVLNLNRKWDSWYACKTSLRIYNFRFFFFLLFFIGKHMDFHINCLPLYFQINRIKIPPWTQLKPITNWSKWYSNKLRVYILSTWKKKQTIAIYFFKAITTNFELYFYWVEKRTQVVKSKINTKRICIYSTDKEQSCT